jgi:hypothetical protein
MTKQEFISKVATWRAHQNRNMAIALLPGILLLAVWFTFKPHDWALVSTTHLIFWIGSPFLGCVVLVLAPWLAIRYTFKRHGLSCPSCGKPLGGVEAIAIATGKCGSCGEQILNDASSTPKMA